MKLKTGVGASLLVVALVGYVAFGAGRSNAPPSKENPRSSTAEKVEGSRDPLAEELATLPEGATVQLTEQQAPEIFQAFRERIAAAGKEQPGQSPSEVARRGGGVSMGSVETIGGTLAIFDRGDGVVRLLAVAVNHENPDLNKGDQGLAFSAVITANGVEVSSVDTDRLARFVGVGKEQSGTLGDDGRVVNVDRELVSVGDSPNATVQGGATDGGADQTASVALQCGSFTSAGVCCTVATETKVCFCCASVSPLAIGCACMPLQ